MKKLLKNRNTFTYALVILTYLICQLAMSGMIDGFKMSRSLKGQLVPICVYIVMAVSLNLTVGISGELSLGHAGFMSVGAFSGVLVSQWILAAFPESPELVRLVLALVGGGALAGWPGVANSRRGDGILLTDLDLFPPGSVSLNGLKVFGEWPTERVIGYTATLIRASGSGLDKLFHDLLRTQASVMLTANPQAYLCLQQSIPENAERDLHHDAGTE